MNRSFRFQLALRAAGAMSLGLLAISAVTLFALRSSLDRDVDALILSVASIQAASLTDAPSGEMHFHEWDLTPDEASSVTDLVSYAQVWQADGVSLLRNQYMTSDLPLDREHLTRAGDGELIWVDMDWEGLAIRSLYYPLERMGEAHERHVLQVAAPLQARNQLLARVAGFLGLLVVMLAGATFAGAGWLAERAVRPVNEVIGQAEEIGAGSLDHRIQAYADTQEYRRLVEVLNTMLARIQGAFEAQRRFTADASHELRSPLTAMRGELEIAMRREREPSEYRRVLESTLEEVVRLSTITEDLLTL
ncbi:MAG: histidine kinase dimerization/phospho-acceptor domain-containing protein, partial [Planctomycetota bacterium]